MQRQSRAVRALAVATVIFVSLVVTCLVLEGVLRLTAPAPSGPTTPSSVESAPSATVRDSVLAWSLRPSAHVTFASGTCPTDVHTNALGLRGPELGATDGERAVVLVLGDSYGFGWGVDERDSFPRLLEGMLRARHPENDIVVLNACVPGYGLLQQKGMLERALATTDPSIVVTTFSLANDPIDDMRFERFAAGELDVYDGGGETRNRLMRWLLAHSRLAALIDARTASLRLKLANSSPEAVTASGRGLRALLDCCSKRGLRVLQLQIPHRWEVKGRPGAGLLRATSSSARRLRERVSSEYGAISVDAAPALLEIQEDTEGAYIANDAHWTPDGHRAVAQAICDAMPETWFEAPAATPALSR